jgi:hypothetical protein
MSVVPRIRISSILRLVVAGAVLIGFYSVSKHFFRAVKDQGVAEAARDARPKPARTTTIATPAPLQGTVPTSGGNAGPTTTAAVTDAAQLQIASATASSQSDPATDSCQRPVSYDASNVKDNEPSTAWRVAGDGVGATLTLTLAGPTHLSEVGLIPGYAKRDPCVDVDRFPQLRRITRVRWTFDNGASVEQRFEDRADLQSLGVDVVTAKVTLLILATTTDPPQLDYTAISDVRLLGVPT